MSEPAVIMVAAIVVPQMTGDDEQVGADKIGAGGRVQTGPRGTGQSHKVAGGAAGNRGQGHAVAEPLVRVGGDDGVGCQKALENIAPPGQ